MAQPFLFICRNGITFMDQKENIKLIIYACLEGKVAGQKKLYQLYFSYAISIALRYADDLSEAEDIVNEAFLKVFRNLNQYDTSLEFRPWFKVILIHAAIDYIKKHKKIKFSVLDYQFNTKGEDVSGLQQLFAEDIMKEIQLLPPKYRLVFNLYAVEGYNHVEIAQKLGISVGGSKSNYSRARKILRKKLEQLNTQKSIRYGG